MFETPVKYELPYNTRPSAVNVKPFGTAVPKSKVASGVASGPFSVVVSKTRTCCLPLISPKDATSRDPSGERSRSYMTVPYGHVTTCFHSRYGGGMRTRVQIPFR